jgi:beta-N-acetylhexosaminidase
VEQSARKILAAKYDLGLARQRLVDINEIDRVVGSPESVKLANDIAARAVTLVRDDTKLLPLPPDKRIFILGVTNGDDRLFIARPFLERLRAAGRRFDVAVLDERATPAEINAARTRAARADVVVAALYGRVRSGAVNSVGLPEAGAGLLRDLLQGKKPVVGISFGNPYLLQAFPELPVYVVSYGDMPSLQTATARTLIGQAAFTGRLPISLPGLYPRGTGIQR